jgi:hypothetical protein
MGKICDLLFHARANAFQPGPPHSFFWGHLKIFGEALESTGGGSIDRALKDLTQYAPDKVLLYFHLHTHWLILALTYGHFSLHSLSYGVPSLFIMPN